MNHLYKALELKKTYPEETDGFTAFEIKAIWEEHSQDYDAQWLMPEREDVRQVFEHFRYSQEHIVRFAKESGGVKK